MNLSALSRFYRNSGIFCSAQVAGWTPPVVVPRSGSSFRRDHVAERNESPRSSRGLSNHGLRECDCCPGCVTTIDWSPTASPSNFCNASLSAFDGTQFHVEWQFAYHQIIRDILFRQQSVSTQDSNGHWGGQMPNPLSSHPPGPDWWQSADRARRIRCCGWGEGRDSWTHGRGYP